MSPMGVPRGWVNRHDLFENRATKEGLQKGLPSQPFRVLPGSGATKGSKHLLNFQKGYLK